MKGKTIAMIPARIGSQRLARKNLREIQGVPLIARAIRKCHEAACFDEIWVNSDDDIFAPIALAEQAQFHLRPAHLGDHNATSEDFIEEFLREHECDRLVQVHSIAPLLTASEVRDFVASWNASGEDVMLSCIHDQIEVAFQGVPVNFTFDRKTNSQELTPVQRITWSITGWKSRSFLEAKDTGKVATYYGRVGFFPVSAISGHVVKTEADLQVADALIRLSEGE